MLILGRECRVVRDNALIQSAQTAAATAGLRRTPELLVRGGGGSPFLCGLWRPRIVLPEQTLAALTPCELRHVLMHEMLHAAHRDLPMNWVLTAVRALHWWNPFLHIAIRALLADRELLRDGEAVTRLAEPDASAGYGRTLLKIALTPAVPVLTPGLSPFFRTETELKHRITMISQSTRHPRLRAGIAAALLAACSVPVFTTAREVPASAAESPPAKSETPSLVPENSQAIPLNSVPALLPPPVNSLHAPVPDPPAPAAADGKKRQSSPLEVLKAMAGRLREKGLSDEADSIEAQIALIGAAAAQEEVLALRAEMATMRAAIAKLESQPSTGVPLTSAEKLRAEYAALLEAGWGPKHPKVLATAGQILKAESLLRKRQDAAATPDAQNSPAVPRASVAEESLPFGVAVIGKRGFVYSPYAQEKGYVDVRELSSGTRVKCPYSGKLFRVP